MWGIRCVLSLSTCAPLGLLCYSEMQRMFKNDFVIFPHLLFVVPVSAWCVQLIMVLITSKEFNVVFFRVQCVSCLRCTVQGSWWGVRKHNPGKGGLEIEKRAIVPSAASVSCWQYGWSIKLGGYYHIQYKQVLFCIWHTVSTFVQNVKVITQLVRCLLCMICWILFELGY